ncbi:glycosyltransferase family 39 protein [Actinospica sp. MGRD01-02]|uniref:Glycosyltransferase family 39 protein n=1 Tax=Actinospica acidithermotolerans TaxID=2828514 RepID=A0A941II32_9ACTN|nr:glycosyltransferase family 39 protein [Actinospica acidithermotolerans]MBR7825763.1 glycosyltransferase family 39 protein [Actinospica acidithermotolerans]
MSPEPQGTPHPPQPRRIPDVLAAGVPGLEGGQMQPAPTAEPAPVSGPSRPVAPVFEPMYGRIEQFPPDYGVFAEPSQQEGGPLRRRTEPASPSQSPQQHATFDLTVPIPVVKTNGDGGSGQAQSHADAQMRRSGVWTGMWTRRGGLLAILVAQAGLSLRNNNTAFVDEALYLYSGHLEIAQTLHGTPTGANFWSFFSGAPVLYPILGAMADGIGGLFAARLLSLAFMLGATCMLYLLTRRMLGTRAALFAAAAFSCTEPVIFVGNLATYDAPALFLLSLATWIVVRYARSSKPLYLFAVLPAALAVGTKYAALMFVPVIVVIAFMTAFPEFGKRALVRPVALAVGIAATLYVALHFAGETALKGVEVTTTSRAQGHNTVSQVLTDAGQWGGALFLICLVGAAFLIALPNTHDLPHLPKGRWSRLCLAALLCGTALMPPLYQAHLHTTVSLQKHVGFGLFFAAPLAGYGLARIADKHVLRTLVAISLLGTTLVLGAFQSLTLFHVWPNSSAMVSEIAQNEKPNGRYLVGSDAVAVYGLRATPGFNPHQFIDTWSLSYRDSAGQLLTGTAAFTAAIKAGYFQVIVYTGAENPPVEAVIEADLSHAANYKLVATIPEHTSNGALNYYVWVRQATVKR